MSGPRVTVIMPCYNSEEYVAQTIETVLEQSYRNFHFVAGNDGSTDNTAEILLNYADVITIVEHADRGNYGQAATYNLCLTHVKTEFIAFIDNDDLWHPDKLLKQVEAMDDNPDVGFVYTNGDVIDSNGEVLYPFFDDTHRETNEMGAILLDCYVRTPSAVMVRTSILQSAGNFKEGMIPDQDMWIRIKELTDFHFIDQKMIQYRTHNKQLSNLSNEKMWHDAFKTLHDAMERYPYERSLYRKRCAVIHFRLGKCAVRNRSYLRTLYHFFTAFMSDPLRSILNIKQVLQ